MLLYIQILYIILTLGWTALCYVVAYKCYDESVEKIEMSYDWLVLHTIIINVNILLVVFLKIRIVTAIIITMVLMLVNSFIFTLVLGEVEDPDQEDGDLINSDYLIPITMLLLILGHLGYFWIYLP